MADLLVVRVLLVDLILEVLLQKGVLSLEILNLFLKLLHFSRLVVQDSSHLLELLLL